MRDPRGMVTVAIVTAAIAGCKADPSSGPSSAAPENAAPVVAGFIDLVGDPGTSLPLFPCHDQILTVVSGKATAGEDTLSPGDVLVSRGLGSVSVKGSGRALLAQVTLATCDYGTRRKIVRADAAPELTFMHGAMHAHLDVDPTVSPAAYFGRLSGTAAVPEHDHAGTWEVLCTVKARGTFTLAGDSKRIGVGECLTIPPDTKHSWQPDPGETLEALQLYWPPGPEQRFKKLAADEAPDASLDASRQPDARALLRDH